MKQLRIAALTLSLVVLGYTSSATAAITGTKHDLSATDTTNKEICVFCHTPHGSDTGAPAPLWNRVLGQDTDYNKYVGVLITGSQNLDTTGVSLACLSCHDGTQGVDVVINAPSGNIGVYNYNASGAALGADVAMTGTPVPMLGTDLTNDHPVGIQYAGGGIANDCTGTATDTAFKPCSEVGLLPVVPVTVATVTTNLPLYESASGPLVECATCHDVHADTDQFLRVANDSSAVCLGCHNK